MTWQQRVRNLKRDVVAIALAVRDPRVPWYAKAVGACVVAYALSPIDLIPDFVPVLGYLDDLVLVPLGLMLVLRLIPADILAEHRVAASALAERPVSRAGAFAVIGMWILAALLLATCLVASSLPSPTPLPDPPPLAGEGWAGGWGRLGRGVFGAHGVSAVTSLGRSHCHDQHHLRRGS
jgi:uncharacterized membrane protein YkvA (DUF1232 family)